MQFDEILAQVTELLQRQGRVSYRALKIRFQLSDDHLEGVKDELISAQRIATDEEGKVLVWVGKGINGEIAAEGETGKQAKGETEKDTGPWMPDAGLNRTGRPQLIVTDTSLIGRDREVRLLRERWEQVKEGHGQAVLVAGEPGIGKSCLVQTFAEQILQEGATWLEFCGSLYHQHTIFYPIIEYFQRMLQFQREDSPEEKLRKLTAWARGRALLQGDAVPLLAALLSLPHPTDYPALVLSAQKRKEKIQQTILMWIVEQAETAPICCTWEDLHWVDPSTLDMLTLLFSHVPPKRLLVLLTFRPNFTPPWGRRSSFSQLTLGRLERPQVEAMVKKISRGKIISAEVIRQIVTKTDGLPLFVEGLTTFLLETGGHQQGDARDVRVRRAVPLLLTIPPTLPEVLMARLDRLNTAKEVAQVAATIGQAFSYKLLKAVSPWDEDTLQQELQHLVDAGLISQHGELPQATYLFKHALIQEAAYQSLIQSTRQEYHQQIAQVLVNSFPATQETQPELLAHHYTEAGMISQAIPYWQQAGEAAVQYSAYVEATQCFTQGIALLQTLPDTLERTQQEVLFQTMLGNTLMVTKGIAAPEVGAAFTRLSVLCQQGGDSFQLFGVLASLRTHWHTRGEARKALESAEQLLRIARQEQDSDLFLQAYLASGISHYIGGTPAIARMYCDQARALYDPQQHRDHALFYGYDPRVLSLEFLGFSLWLLGFPQQAREESQAALLSARELSHPYSLIAALIFTSWVRMFCQEEHEAVGYLTEACELCVEYRVPTFLVFSTILQGRVLIRQGSMEEGLGKIQEALAIADSIEAHGFRSEILACQAEVYQTLGQAEEGLSLIAQALEFVGQSGERYYEAELYRLRGTLTLQQEGKEQGVGSKEHGAKSTEQGARSKESGAKIETDPQGEAEACFLKAIEIAQKQQAKSWELRASTSLVRLWQQQALEQGAGSAEQGARNTQHEARTKLAEAHNLLSEVYNWFTEGFDTKDLREAKILIDSLGSSVQTSQKE